MGWAIWVPFVLTAQNPDQRPGFYHQSTGDLGSESFSFYPWYAYKYLHPIKTAAKSTIDFFKAQDLGFNPPDHGAAVQARATVLAVGDIMVKTDMTRQNSSRLFDDIADKLSAADIAFGNLEGPAAPGKKASAFPRYNFNPDLVKLLKEKGFDVLSTANNHSLDQGPEGLLATLDYLDRLGFRHHGAARSRQERDGQIPVLEANGVRIAFLSYTFATNGRKIPLDKPWMVNRVEFNVIGKEPELSLVRKDIAAARKMGAEVVVVALHWSLEYEFFPEQRIIDRGHQIAEMGADIILGCHPHCLQPMEKYIPQNPGRKGLPQTLIIYSLGNFIPDHPQVDFRTTVLLEVELAKGREKTWISKVSVTPLFFYDRKDYRFIRIDNALADKTAPQYAFLKPKDFKDLAKAQNIISTLFLPSAMPKN